MHVHSSSLASQLNYAHRSGLRRAVRPYYNGTASFRKSTHAQTLLVPRAAESPPSAIQPALGGQDFYTLLGLTPSADVKDIKKAYYSLSREFHPDLNAEAEAQELMCLLNEIYEVLTDADSRATYDMISGFSPESLNPFLDRSYARDQVFVDEIDCIGCGKCARWCPKTFIIEGSKYGRARVISQTSDHHEDIQIAIESCPVDCIHWVSAPQLSLLEAALANMQRVEVWIMMRLGKKTGLSVFQVASNAWDKRMEAYRKKREATFDFSVASFREREETEEVKYESIKGRDGRRIANLAAAAARAARMWRQAQEDMKETQLLTD